MCCHLSGVSFYRDTSLAFFEVKVCNSKSISYKKHFHEELSIGVIDKGESKVWCDGQQLQVEAGRIIVIPPYLPHACNPEEGSDWKYKMLFFHMDWVHHLLGDEARLHAPFLLENKVNPHCKDLLNQFVHCMSSQKTPLETETVAIHLIHTIIQRDTVEALHVHDSAKAKKDMQEIKDYLHEHYLEPITLEKLESVSGLSKFHIVHLFKKANKIPPHAYQNLLRINFAKKELRKKRPIAEIAIEAGFYDQSHFTRVFKQVVGVTPQKYPSPL